MFTYAPLPAPGPNDRTLGTYYSSPQVIQAMEALGLEGLGDLIEHSKAYKVKVPLSSVRPHELLPPSDQAQVEAIVQECSHHNMVNPEILRTMMTPLLLVPYHPYLFPYIEYDHKTVYTIRHLQTTFTLISRRTEFDALERLRDLRGESDIMAIAFIMHPGTYTLFLLCCLTNSAL